MKNKAVLLDRDDTLIVDRGYIRDAEEVELLPGVSTALAKLQDLGYRLVVVSNQSGIGRGLMTHGDVDGVHQRLRGLLADGGVSIDGFYYCPHSPDALCPCRKPKPGLLLQACKDLQIDPTLSYMVGDKCSDAEAGRAAGMKPVLLSGRESHGCTHFHALIVVPTLVQFADLLKRGGKLCDTDAKDGEIHGHR